ncbi:unnamed protein product [Alternaria alternata]
MSAGDSLIEECTNGTTKAGLYLSRLGLEKEIKNPNKPGKPKFSIPELDDLWEATNLKANAIAATYNSRKAIREALRRRDICLDEIARDCLVGYGPKNLEQRKREDKYLRHLIYEHPSDARKIRLLVSAWTVQRACRKAEYDRREGKTPQKEVMKSSTDFSSFIEAIRVKSAKRTHSTILASSYSSESSDELNVLGFEDPAKPPVGFKHAVQLDAACKPQSQRSRKSHDVRHTSAKRQKKQTAVAVVIPARKPQHTEPSKTTSRTRSQPLDKGKTVPRSARSGRKGSARETLRLTTPCRTTPRRTRTGTHSERSVQSNADTNMNLLVTQLKADRNELSICLHDLLSPRNPGCHSLTAIKRMTGLIDTIVINDAQGLRENLGGSYDKHKIALDRWLGCVKTLVEFREMTGLEGDEDTIKASFRELLSPIREEARLLRQRKRQEIVKWFEKPASKELESTTANFCKEVAFVLLKMISWGGLDMKLKEFLGIMVPFTKRLLEWFSVEPISSTARN